jgi:hypothetical protein
MYGILGAGSAPAKVIVASLQDLGHDSHYVIPWYGDVTPGLEAVYDWVLDHNIQFTLVQNPDGKKAPSVLRTMCETLHDSQDVNASIVKMLIPAYGHALILWDDKNEDASFVVATQAIEAGLPTLELTNGLVPIVFDDQEQSSESVADEADIMVEGDSDESTTPWDRDTLENMPAAVLKRMAQSAGATTKTKEEAIKAILGEDEEDPTAKWVPVPVPERENINEEFALVDAAPADSPAEEAPYKITVEMYGGRQVSFYGTNSILKKMLDVVASELISQ